MCVWGCVCVCDVWCVCGHAKVFASMSCPHVCLEREYTLAGRQTEEFIRQVGAKCERPEEEIEHFVSMYVHVYTCNSHTIVCACICVYVYVCMYVYVYVCQCASAHILSQDINMWTYMCTHFLTCVVQTCVYVQPVLLAAVL